MMHARDRLDAFHSWRKGVNSQICVSFTSVTWGKVTVLVSKNWKRDGVAMWTAVWLILPSGMEENREAVDNRCVKVWHCRQESPWWQSLGDSFPWNLPALLAKVLCVERGFVSSKGLRSWLHRTLFSEACAHELRLVIPRSLNGKGYNSHAPLKV